YWPINPRLSWGPWSTFQLDFVRCVWAILPATILWGASFPLALAAVAAPGQDPGRLVGRVYAANTAGAVVWALGASLFLVGWVGLPNSHWVFLVVSSLAALLMFLSWLWSYRANPAVGPDWGELALPLTGAGAVLALVLPGVLLVPKVPGELVAYDRE